MQVPSGAADTNRPSDPLVGGAARIETRVSSRVSHEERRRRRKKDASSNDQIFFPPTPPLLALFPRFTRLALEGKQPQTATRSKKSRKTKKKKEVVPRFSLTTGIAGGFLI